MIGTLISRTLRRIPQIVHLNYFYKNMLTRSGTVAQKSFDDNSDNSDCLCKNFIGNFCMRLLKHAKNYSLTGLITSDKTKREDRLPESSDGRFLV